MAEQQRLRLRFPMHPIRGLVNRNCPKPQVAFQNERPAEPPNQPWPKPDAETTKT